MKHNADERVRSGKMIEAYGVLKEIIRESNLIPSDAKRQYASANGRELTKVCDIV